MQVGWALDGARRGNHSDAGDERYRVQGLGYPEVQMPSSSFKFWVSCGVALICGGWQEVMLGPWTLNPKPYTYRGYASDLVVWAAGLRFQGQCLTTTGY